MGDGAHRDRNVIQINELRPFLSLHFALVQVSLSAGTRVDNAVPEVVRVHWPLHILGFIPCDLPLVADCHRVVKHSIYSKQLELFVLQ